MPDEPDEIDRRRFLSGAALGAAGLVVGSAANATASPPVHSHDDEQTVPSDIALRVKALESLLIEKGMVQSSALDEIVQTYEHRVGPRNGARVVARAWTNPDYKRHLIADGSAAIAELGYTGAQGEHMVVVENTPTVHNMVVCTLCSCYPWPTLGLPPAWYKSSGYRSRAVIDPRGVLREFGVNLPDEVEVRVCRGTNPITHGFTDSVAISNPHAVAIANTNA